MKWRRWGRGEGCWGVLCFTTALQHLSIDGFENEKNMFPICGLVRRSSAIEWPTERSEMTDDSSLSFVYLEHFQSSGMIVMSVLFVCSASVSGVWERGHWGIWRQISLLWRPKFFAPNESLFCPSLRGSIPDVAKWRTSGTASFSNIVW